MMNIRFLGLFAIALFGFAAQASEQVDSEAVIVEWQAPDCSSYTSYKRCRNAVKTEYRRMRQQEMKSQGLSFWYYERPSYKGDSQKALKDEVPGMLTIAFDVEKDGTTSNVKVTAVSSEEAKVYGETLVSAITQWTFVPLDNKVEGVTWRTELFFEEEACKDKPKEGVEKKECYSD
ncbi:hypothetical protein KO525_04730 [Psychrosphaera sp. B3R10]|uniref:energy transducer TonB n=1 Tax=unclassified Psychrosphaera TaxID=2641570 RepID=UPI001C07FA64|nr:MULTISPECIES: hypothetical protein [unclassified Psychrosphaera]MBU2881534.1 hypothetical protein [Psychrosphaera sp. I2R16]MBU2988681.1 hypothetical protein [Psychrosphaera sp. B3R10]MDO6721341.1 hypothetical protein [Psychrosphaera sp. 1_MG-2023]